MKFKFDEGIIKADLERGSVDIEIINIVIDDPETNAYIEMDTIYKGEGLAPGDQVEVSSLKTDVVIRVYGDNAARKHTILPKK